MGDPGRIEIARIESRALRGNALGDPAIRDVPVILPPGYGAAGRRYPVVYVLAAFTGTAQALLHHTPWSPGLKERVESLRSSGAIGDLIAVLPDCWTRLGGSQYLDSTATGRYFTHLTEELIPEIDRRFATIPDRRARGVLGRSSGGFGSLNLAMKRPDLVSAAACLSGDMLFEQCYRRYFAPFADELARAGGIEPFLRKFAESPKKSGAQIQTIEILAMTACYSPNPGTPPLGFDLPVDLETGETREDVFRRWLEFDPLHACERHADALRSLSLLFIDCGTRDEYYLHLGARALAKKLRTLAIPHVHEEYDDGHMGTAYRFERVLPLIWRAINMDS